MKMLAPYLWVGIGGFFGANARFLASNMAQRFLGIGFPYATFLVNVTGSFLLGVVMTVLAEKTLAFGEGARLAVAVGFLGAYTTFSTFEYECHILLGENQFFLTALNMFGSLFVGLLALRLGITLARHLT